MTLLTHKTFVLKKLKYKIKIFNNNINQSKQDSDINKNEIGIAVDKNIAKNYMIIGFVATALKLPFF